METHSELDTLIDAVSSSKPDALLSLRLVSCVLDFSNIDSLAWIEEFGDPLSSLPSAKALIEQLGFDWCDAMSAGAAALEGTDQWVLPDVAPHAVCWSLSRLLAEQAGSERVRARRPCGESV
jgi:hypothetical protein